MALDPRLPVVVGVGQLQRRPRDSVEGLPSPIEMMAGAARLAADDVGPGSGSGARLLRAVGSVQVVDVLSWRYGDPAALLAAELGASPRETVATVIGGNTPQTLVNQAALAIQRAEVDVVLIAGAEAMYTRRVARRTGETITWPKDDRSPTRVVGDDRPPLHDVEVAAGLTSPPDVYPLLECALRLARGEDADAHTARIAELWSRFSHVAAANPHAWSREAHTADDIATPSPGNRMIASPYTKLMNANIQVDQAAALLLCSVDAARSAGVPEERWVFPIAGADAHDHWFLSERASLAASPAIAACGRAINELSGIGVDDIAHVDLYSCFPAAVQLAADALGIDAWDPARVPTLTGGLTFAGGPGNNYVTHSIATLVARLRDDPGAFGLTTALGWYATKHSLGLWSSSPPPGGFRWRSAQSEVDALPRRPVADDAYDGPTTVEAYTVLYERDGSPTKTITASLTDDGRRVWACAAS